jgi:LPXTG-site transpeptidase (sortase) family protein
MLRDLIICILGAGNLLIFSFIGLNYEAFQKVAAFQTGNLQKTHIGFDQISLEMQERLISYHRAAQKKNQILQTKSENYWSGYISIPKIHLIAPVNYDHGLQDDQVEESLNQGILSLTSFVPPEKNGQMLLFGHSSDYPWNNNPYATVFTLLPQVQQGDLITITNGGREYQYHVQKTLVTEAGLEEITSVPIASNQLILSTCYPIGFFSKRFNVIATPIENT